MYLVGVTKEVTPRFSTSRRFLLMHKWIDLSLIAKLHELQRRKDTHYQPNGSLCYWFKLSCSEDGRGCSEVHQTWSIRSTSSDDKLSKGVGNDSA